MKKLQDYLMESKKTWNFKIKIACDLPENFDKRFKTMLEKYSVADMKMSKTPIQKLPLDFNGLTNREVHIYEVTFNYPTTPPELETQIRECFCFSDKEFVVRYTTEPTEEYQKESNDAYIVKMESELENPYGDVAQTLVGQQRVFKLFQELSSVENKKYNTDVGELTKDDNKQTPLFTPKSEPKGVKK